MYSFSLTSQQPHPYSCVWIINFNLNEQNGFYYNFILNWDRVDKSRAPGRRGD